MGVEHYETLAEKAAALTYAIAKAHACPDGNKRLAVILLMAFLHLNDWILQASQTEIITFVEGAAESPAVDIEATIGRMARWIDDHLEAANGEGL